MALQDIVDHVKSELRITVSRGKVHRLMKAPVKSNIAAKRYKGLIDARVPPKRNDTFKMYTRIFTMPAPKSVWQTNFVSSTAKTPWRYLLTIKIKWIWV